MATLIIKCTERCNANCSYCEVIHAHAGVSDMSRDTLELLFQRIDEFLRTRPDETLLFTWHGGEPMLLGPEFFAMALELQNQYCAETKGRISHAIQSNLTRLTKRHIAPLKALGIDHVGTSYDPMPGIRGLGPSVNTRAYNRAFLRGTSLLERHGMTWGLIYVVTQKSLADPVSVFHTLCNLNPRQGFMMNPVLVAPDGPRHLAITPEEYAEFLGEIFPVWFKSRDRYLGVQPFQYVWDRIVNGSGTQMCSDAGRCWSTHLNIDPLGEVSQCGRASDLGILEWGNIRDSSLSELYERSRNVLSGRTVRLRDGECKDCVLFSICSGGCPIDGFEAHGSVDRKTGWCNAKRRFLFKYFEPVTGIDVSQNLH